MSNVTKFEALEVEVLIGIANESAELVEASAKKAVEHAERCGRALNAIKAKLPHGEWGAWLGKNFDYSQRHATRYMTIASNWTRVSNLEGDGSIREALRMIADDPDTPKRECKPAVEVIEVAAEIVAVDMPAVEVITAVATVKPAKKVKPPAPEKPGAAKPAKPQPVAPAEDPPEFDLEEATDRLTKAIDDELFNWPGSAIQDGSEGVQWLWRQIELCLTSWTRPPETSWPRIAASAANAESPADGNPQSSLTDN